MQEQENELTSFAYLAQTEAGMSMSGTIEASGEADCGRRLAALGLRLISIKRVVVRPTGNPRGKAVRGDDFIAFNQQLAQLTRGGLPIEHGLRLIARDMGRSRMKQTIARVVEELESGKTLPQAIESRRGQFPRLYGRLVDAGIRAGNLPGVLLNMGRHLTLVSRLRATLWRAISYPALIFAMFIGLFLFMFLYVVPQFAPIYHDLSKNNFRWARNPYVPSPFTQMLMDTSEFVASGPVWTGLAAAGLLIVLVIVAMRWTAAGREIGEGLARRMPLIGPVLRLSLVSRWCDAVGIGVEAGLDLPAAIELADDAIDSGALKADGQKLIAAVSSGQPLARAGAEAFLPATVPATMDLATGNGNLAENLATLSQLYQQQAELRMGNMQVILAPLLMILLGLFVALMICAVLVPLVQMLQSFSS